MAKPKTIRARVLRDFNDAGTERRFTADKVVPLTEGEFDNFAAAGLVEPADATPAS